MYFVKNKIEAFANVTKKKKIGKIEEMVETNIPELIIGCEHFALFVMLNSYQFFLGFPCV